MISKRHFKPGLVVSISFVIFLFLNSCGTGWWDPGDARKIDPNVDVRAREAIEEGRAVSADGLIKGRKGGGTFQFASSNVMWRATLEVLDFLPLANVDYAGGLIITDWYNEGTAAGESIKITVRFLSTEIRADGLKIIVHKKVCSKVQNCTIKKISSSLQEEVKNAILAKATIFERENLDENKKAYRKKYGNRIERIKTRERGGADIGN